jgi:hypothetical protein
LGLLHYFRLKGKAALILCLMPMVLPVKAGYATAVFSLVQEGVVVSEAGVPASPPTTAARLFVDYGTWVSVGPAGQNPGPVDVFTGIAVVNPGTAVANVTDTLRDMQGQALAVGHGTLAAVAHRARFLNQLQELAPDFVLPAGFSAATRYGTLEVASAQALSVLGLRMTINQRGNTLFTSVPVADMTRSASTAPLYFPQVADGDGYTSSLILLNTGDRAQSGSLRFYADDGSPLVVGKVGSAADSAFRYVIPANGVYLLQTDGAPTTTHVGSVQLTPDTGTTTPVGAGLFSLTRGGILVTESGIAASTPMNHARVYVDLSGGHDSGLAIAAPDGSAVRVTLRAYQADGVMGAGGGAATLDLAGNGHRAAFVGQWISGLPMGFRGVLDISAPTTFAALTLRSLTNGRNDFLLTTFPMADMTRAAPSPLVFPHIADGGGYQTEFILLSSGAEAVVMLNFFATDGINGLMFDAKGRLIACQGGSGRLVAIDIQTKAIQPLVSQYQGRRFDRPNDLVTVDSLGNLYLTRPSVNALEVIAPEGRSLGLIPVGESPTNATFGGSDRITLFVTARSSVYTAKMEAAGHQFATPCFPVASTLFFPRLVQTADEWIGLALVNPTAQPAQIGFAAYTNSGALLALRGLTNPRGLAHVDYSEKSGDFSQRTQGQQGVKANIPYQEAVDSLKPSTRYFYRIKYKPAGQSAFSASDE